MKRRNFVAMLAGLPVVGAFFGFMSRPTAAETMAKVMMPGITAEPRRWWSLDAKPRPVFEHARLMPNLPCGGRRMVVRRGMPPAGKRAINAGIAEKYGFRVENPVCVQVDIPKEDLDRLRYELDGATNEQINDAIARYVDGHS